METSPHNDARWPRELTAHQPLLWGLCYRMTGSAADAEDLVQETFLRAMEKPPPRREDLRPWLVRVASNLSRDALRRRRRRAYIGPWLPEAIDTDETDPVSWEPAGEGGTEGRYDLLESVSLAFLLALEALTPNQRAVLLLRDVLDCSVIETAEALGMTESNVKVLHHRARKALGPYESARLPPSPEQRAKCQTALERFLGALSAGDERALRSVFTEDVLLLADGGGEYLAARRPIHGADPVCRLFLGLTKKSSPVERFALRTINGFPAILCERTSRVPTEAPKFILQPLVDGSGQISLFLNLMRPSKIARIRAV